MQRPICASVRRRWLSALRECTSSSSQDLLSSSWSTCVARILSWMSLLLESELTSRSCCFRLSISERRAFTRSPSNSSFFTGRVWIRLTDSANWIVDSVIPRQLELGAMHASMAVLQFPISDPARRKVSLLLRYGTCGPFPAAPTVCVCSRATSREIMRLRAERLLLISLLSFWRMSQCSPFSLSEPARSTQWMWARRRTRVVELLPPPLPSVPAPSGATTRSTCSVTMACDRDEAAFMLVQPTTRILCPKSSRLETSLIFRTALFVSFSTKTPYFGCSRISREAPDLCGVGCRRSRTLSLWISR
mmetsp:Transcript_9780/g.27470  ORF Transcript_9780/g.27470 Transcript_9780/m.27470 type:complete len:305 (+) Transcript_9780:1532-2446(+)